MRVPIWSGQLFLILDVYRQEAERKTRPKSPGVMFSGGGLGRSNWSSHLGDLSYTLHAWRPGFVRLAVISTPASVRSHESPPATGPPEPVVFYNKSSAQTLHKWSLISPDPDYESLRLFRDHKLQIKLIYVACEQNWLVSDACQLWLSGDLENQSCPSTTAQGFSC